MMREQAAESGRHEEKRPAALGRVALGGLAGWLSRHWLSRGAQPKPRLELLDRITLAPRQSLALIEAEGRRFLVATSPEGAPAFLALDELGMKKPALCASGAGASGSSMAKQQTIKLPATRISW